ncbi:hypothetical protein QF001_006570 [Paraburkholderia youngii]
MDDESLARRAYESRANGQLRSDRRRRRPRNARRAESAPRRRESALCYEHGCNVCVRKPVEYDTFIEAVRRLGFFLQVVKLTPAHRLEPA